MNGLRNHIFGGLAGLEGNLYKPKTLSCHRHEDEKNTDERRVDRFVQVKRIIIQKGTILYEGASS